jgi:hypothetical protein
MKWKLKATISVLFGLRILYVLYTCMNGRELTSTDALCSALFTVSISNFVQSSDPGLAVSLPLVWQQIDMSYALGTALTIGLKAFIGDFHTGMGMDMTNYTMLDYAQNSSSEGKKSRLGTIASGGKTTSITVSRTFETQHELQRMDGAHLINYKLALLLDIKIYILYSISYY